MPSSLCDVVQKTRYCIQQHHRQGGWLQQHPSHPTECQWTSKPQGLVHFFLAVVRESVVWWVPVPEPAVCMGTNSTDKWQN